MTSLGTARLGRSMLGDVLDALESLIAAHTAIAVGRHGSLPMNENCGSRIYANTGNGSHWLQQREVPKTALSAPFMPDRAVPMATNATREAVSRHPRSFQ
jgi:hypothetical protein